MNVSKLFLLVLFVLPGFAAQATNCRGSSALGRLNVGIQRHGGSYTTTVSLDGRRLPRLGACWTQTRPSTEHLRCAHGLDDVRVEVYAWAETTSGEIKRSQAVVWSDTDPEYLDLNCR